MKVKILDKSKDKNYLVLKITDTNTTYLNTLRRYLMNETPVMAVEDIEFRQNSSIMYDEMLAHRIGLIPLTTDPKSKLGDGPVKLTVKVTADKKNQVVYSKDFKSKDAKVKPVSGDIPIVTLLEGQELEAEMDAIMGVGKEHAKWSPCLAWYKHFPNIKVTKQPKDPKAIVKVYPHIFEIKGGKLQVNEANLVNFDLLDEKISDLSEGAISYTEKDDEFIFYIESWGQLEAKSLLANAVDAHNDQLKEFKKLVKALK